MKRREISDEDERDWSSYWVIIFRSFEADEQHARQ